MNRRQFLASFAGAAAFAQSSRKPNIVLILADDLGYADLGFTGATDIPTPNLDRLAQSGIVFTNAYVSHPFCSPTRAGLMTGRYQQRFGHENNPIYDPQNYSAGLPTSQITVAQLLRSAGYVTGLSGKWHLGAASKFLPSERGFSEMFYFRGGGHDYFKQELSGAPREYLIPLERDGKPVAEPEYLTDALAREAAAFIRRHHAHPFFLYLAFNTPHTPIQTAPHHAEKVKPIADEKRRGYAAMVTALDEGVGKVMQAIAESNLDAHTLIAFLSDNGGPINVTASHNTPFREGKGTVYEGGIRVPFVMRWQGRLKPGRYQQPVISLDFLPTFTAIAGARTPTNVDGVNLMPYLQGQKSGPPHERLFWRAGGGVSYAVREGRYKLTRQQGAAEQLFDLDADPSEQHDLSSSQPDILRRLHAAYETWNRSNIAPLFESPRPAQKKKG
ncbi:MAG: sulfatase [Bryobacterales bacterium]|nr:sulfatase [Bryobacterales bacterium]